MKSKMIELSLIGGILKMGLLILILITYATTLMAAPMKFKGDSTIEGQFTVSDGTKSLVFIKSDGNMGIGTTSPSQKLHIHSDSNVRLKLSNTAGDPVIDIGSNYIFTKESNNDLYKEVCKEHKSMADKMKAKATRVIDNTLMATEE